MKWKQSKVFNLFKALLLRVIIVCHCIFLYVEIISPKCQSMWIISLMAVGVTLILAEGVYNLGWRLGHEWKWGSPLLLIYIVFIYLPSLMWYDINTYSGHNEMISFGKQPNSSNNAYDREVLSDDLIKNIVLDVFFLVVILARWFIPKGKITLEDLSKLLLINITIIADILDMMKVVRDLRYTECKKIIGEWLYVLGLVSLCLSILQLCLGLTATRNRRFHSIKKNGRFIKSYTKTRPPQIVINDETTVESQQELNPTKCLSRLHERLKRIRSFIAEMTIKFFEKEIWSIVVMLILKELPFAVIRTAFLVVTFLYPLDCAYLNISIFFTLRNYLSIIILINRCYIIFHNPDDVSGSKSCILKSYTSLDPNQSIFNKKVTNTSTTNGTPVKSKSNTGSAREQLPHDEVSTIRSESLTTTTTDSYRAGSLDSQRTAFDWTSSRSSSSDSKYLEATLSKFPGRSYLRNLMSNKLYKMKVDEQNQSTGNRQAVNELATATVIEPRAKNESIATDYSSC